MIPGLLDALFFGGCQIPQDYLARYQGNRVVSGSLIDQSPNGYDAPLINAEQQAKETVYFNGVDAYADISALFAVLASTTEGTIALQFKAPSGGRGYVGFGESAGQGFIQFSVSETDFVFSYKLNGSGVGVSNFNVRYTGSVFTAGEYVNAVFVSDPTSGARLFIEGVGELTPNNNQGTPNDKWFDTQTNLNTSRLQSLLYGAPNEFHECFLVSATFYDYRVGDAGIKCLLNQPHPQVTDSVMFGDSITNGVGASSYSESWAGQWQDLYTTINTAVNGDQAGDMSYEIQTNHEPDINDIYTVMIGTNDHRQYKADATKQGFFEAFFRQSLAWLALPSRTIARDMTESGTWSNTGANSIGRLTTQNGATSQATVSGTGVYVGYIIQNSLSSEGTAEVRIDGNLVGTISTYGDMDTINGRTFAPAAAYFGGLADTSHTVEITVTSTGENFYLDYVAGSPQTPPQILVSNIIKMSAAAYSTYGTSEANVIAYNGIISDVLAEFAADGVAITSVDNFTDIDPSTDLDPDGVHPNDTGHDIIYNNFYEAIP